MQPIVFLLFVFLSINGSTGELIQHPEFLNPTCWQQESDKGFYRASFMSENNKFISFVVSPHTPRRPCFVRSNIALSDIYKSLYNKNSIDPKFVVSYQDNVLEYLAKPKKKEEFFEEFLKEFYIAKLLPDFIVDFLVRCKAIQDFRSAEEQENAKENAKMEEIMSDFQKLDLPKLDLNFCLI